MDDKDRIEGFYQYGDPAPEPPKALNFDELTLKWRNDAVLVSILCATFNHEDYIVDAINGFLSQRTDFAFEVVIRDDASTDQTADIISSYVGLYPNIVRLLQESDNKFPTVKPSGVLLSHAKGDIVAFCEGDDYWFDPNRLQRLVETLQMEATYAGVRDGALMVSDGAINGFLTKGRGGTRTWVVRKNTIDLDGFLQYSPKILTGDRLLEAMINSRGGFGLVPGTSTVYRVHSGGAFTGLMRTDPLELQFQRASSRFWIAMYLATVDARRASLKYLLDAIVLLIQIHPSRIRNLFYPAVTRLLRSLLSRIRRLTK